METIGVALNAVANAVRSVLTCGICKTKDSLGLALQRGFALGHGKPTSQRSHWGCLRQGRAHGYHLQDCNETQLPIGKMFHISAKKYREAGSHDIPPLERVWKL